MDREVRYRLRWRVQVQVHSNMIELGSCLRVWWREVVVWELWRCRRDLFLRLPITRLVFLLTRTIRMPAPCQHDTFIERGEYLLHNSCFAFGEGDVSSTFILDKGDFNLSSCNINVSHVCRCKVMQMQGYTYVLSCHLLHRHLHQGHHLHREVV